MRYFLLIFLVCCAAVFGILGKRGTHFRKTSLYIFPDMEWQLKLRPMTGGTTSILIPSGTRSWLISRNSTVC